MNASGKWLIVAVVVVVGIGGGILVATKNSKTPRLENSNVVGMPVPGSNVEKKVVTSGKVVEVTVEGSNYKFSPATIKAKQGDTVKLTFKSTGGIHNLVIDQFGVETSQLGEGEEEEVEFVADKMGTFEYYCAVANHRAMGMKGTLVVGGE